MSVVIAIDGPAASGKSSVARELARKLGFVYVNSGAMYRAVAWLSVSKGVDPRNAEAVTTLLDSSRIEFGLDRSESTIRIDGTDPSKHLTSPEVNASVSAIATIPAVRERLVAAQRESAQGGRDIVMEGRDIGSVVFPDTPYKFYIDASAEVRAQRRARQGHHDEIIARDKTDSSRKHSPLTIAEDAHVIDSSHLTIDGVVGEIIGRLKLKGLPIAS